jgi:hydrogenase maturation protein HypF
MPTRQSRVKPSGPSLVRARTEVRGCVQGVGFRPFVLRLALRHRLSGWVSNSPQGVVIEVEGSPEALSTFHGDLVAQKPPLAQIEGQKTSSLQPLHDTGFSIRTSASSGPVTTLILPDVATCPACLAELRRPEDRRFRYPFINCTECGPRFSIIVGLPYDRPNTTMRGFGFCELCRAEYENPLDRRFHAQPVACPNCGPHVSMWNPSGETLCERDAALLAAVDELRAGRILAVKGLSGFHLMVLAENEAAVQRLRQRKHREAKPFAVMFPSLEAVFESCVVSQAEVNELTGPASPIVLLERRVGALPVTAAVAPGYRTLGAMLPYTPLHHLLLAELGVPVVATSGNASDEPICTDELDALSRLGGIADCFLVHNRPIARHADDSVVQVVRGRTMVWRRGRGLAPAVVGHLPADSPAILAVGADLKNCPAQSYGSGVLTTAHVGDLENELARKAFGHAVRDLEQLLECKPQFLAADLHPDYHATRWAHGQSARVIQIQHHHAHVVSCMVEHGLEGTVLGVSWDGTGLGTDGTIWGGEFLKAQRSDFDRLGHLRTFRLPGGDRAARDGRLAALGLLHEMHGEGAWSVLPHPLASSFTAEERRVLARALERGLNCHLTSSAGRLFDGVAALLGIRSHSRFEGEAAAALESAAASGSGDQVVKLPLELTSQGSLAVDWAPLVAYLVAAQARGTAPGELARTFHLSLARAVVAVAGRSGQSRVVLTGGCFQNRLLHESTASELEQAGFTVYSHACVPPNDGGIAVGQLAAVVAQLQKERA